MYSLFLSSIFLTSIVAAQTTTTVPNIIRSGASTAQFTSGVSGLDAPKINFNNATNFDWWYFDAVSSTTNASIVVVFYLSTDLGFSFRLPFSAISVDIFASFDDGSQLFIPLNSLPGSLGEAKIVSSGDGASGTWASTGFSFTGSSDLSSYTVTINNALLGIHGSLVLNSVAPAHYPCGPNRSGENLEVSPNIGWANAIPDANATASFTIGGKKLAFTGPGYHDKNWSLQPFAQNVDSWYWGHGRLGPYSIVWFDVLAANGTEYVSSYASYNGKIIAASCSGIKVRPTGKNSQYPPVLTSGNPDGFHIDLDLGAANGGVLSINVTSTLSIADVVLYTRWIGKMTGGVPGGPTYTGVALYEEFKLTAT